MATMKVRSFVLLACMLVVPALALFSHLTPPAARSLLRHAVCDPICRLAGSMTASLPVTASGVPNGALESTAPAARSASTEAVSREGVPSAASALADRSEASFPVSGPTGNPSALIPTLPLVTVPAMPVPVEPTRMMPRSRSDWATLASMRSQLTALGATAILCTPQPGETTGFASSCRIVLDRDGQLHRMFHARGPDEAAAMQSLIDQIEGWRTRQAGGLRQRH